jgi:hypothetical protein
MLLSLAAIVAGSEMLVTASSQFISRLGWSETLFAMTVLAFLVSVEEIARELPAAIQKRPDITYGNFSGRCSRSSSSTRVSSRSCGRCKSTRRHSGSPCLSAPPQS